MNSQRPTDKVLERDCLAKKRRVIFSSKAWQVAALFFLVSSLMLPVGCGTGWRMDYGEPAAQFLSANVAMQGRRYVGEKVTVQGAVTEVLLDRTDGAWIYLNNGVRCNLGEFQAMAGEVSVGETVLVDGILRQCDPEDVLLEPALLRDPAARKAVNSERETKKEVGKPDEPSNDHSLGEADSPLDLLSPGLNEIQVEHEGRSRRLLITTPQSLEAGRSYPVLFCFHGAGGKADGQSKRWSRHADPHNLIVVSFEAVQPMAKWNFKDEFHAADHDDVGLVVDFAKSLIAAGFADPRAIYATGHSSGGLFCYRLAKQTDLFAAFAPMSCGMVKGAHTPAKPTQPVSILQVIGDQDKSFHGSTNPKVTMYSAAQRIDLWRTFNGCAAQPVITRPSEEVALSTYTNEVGIEVVLCEVKGEGHHLRSDLRDETDVIALDFLLKHRRDSGRSSDEAP